MELNDQTLILVLAAVAVVALLAFMLLRPKQRVTLSDDRPQRPHMAAPAPSPEGDRSVADDSVSATSNVAPASDRTSVSDGIASATSDVAGGIIEAPVHANLPGASGPPDDLQKLKGVGPKFADLLNERGIMRFEQIARLTPEEADRLDATFGPFRGRMKRDRIVEQADYLARGDEDGFQHVFGKL